MKRKRLFIVATILLLVTASIVIFLVSVGKNKSKAKSGNEQAQEEVISDDLFMTDPIESINPSLYSGQKIEGSPFVGDFINTYVAANYSSAEEVFGTDS